MSEINLSDYSLVGENAVRAIQRGLAEATWYTCPVPKEKMRELLARRDGPALRDTLLWFLLLGATGGAAYLLWPSWWCAIPFALYGVCYGTISDSRWHEAGHGTAFATDWMNNAVYELASFMVVRESVPWRWSHTRHHSDTIIVGRDPEIAAMRPPKIFKLLGNGFNLAPWGAYLRHVALHCGGKLDEEERTYLPPAEYHKVFRNARIYTLIYLSVITLALWTRSVLPLLYIGLPTLYGAWLMPIYSLTQHTGLAENVLDHRLNCRTILMNPINRYIYWNMNFHLEHHMFPLVPYHALPRLHELIREDCPRPYSSIFAAYREIVPAVLWQRRDPTYYVKRALPTPTEPASAPPAAPALTAAGPASSDGWIEAGSADLLGPEEVLRFDHGGQTYAIYRTDDGAYYATDGICTHGNAHLADGLVKGRLIECPKHNGRFDVRDGSPQRRPACIALRSYPVRLRAGRLFLQLAPDQPAAGDGQRRRFRVISNENVATFIKELVLEPEDPAAGFSYRPGEYVQLEIPAYGELKLSEIAVAQAYRPAWEARRLFDLVARNPQTIRRNYSLATNPATDRLLRFNVRLAVPPTGQDCPTGAGSAYVHRLKPGDMVTVFGPYGDFHLKPGAREMVYLGGGAGMAPLRSHLSHLLETQASRRKISFWYGARSLPDVFYRQYFEDLAARHPNFTFHLVLSEPREADGWTGRVGLIHGVLHQEYLKSHADPAAVEYYLCGPPPMIRAAIKLLQGLGVAPAQIACDEF